MARSPPNRDTNRAGAYQRQPEGYRAFVPARLPPIPAVAIESLQAPLSRADRALGRLDGSVLTLPNPDLFVMMYVRDVDEVVNYVAAMNLGLSRLRQLPVSVRLIREIHERLMQRVRGSTLSPGELRRSQNWIGPPDCTLQDATFMPPPPSVIAETLSDLESFLHAEDDLPLLIKIGLAHAKFETIHPFLDGNGRVGRLLITSLPCEREVLRKPVLYLSHYFRRYRQDYYDHLQAVRDSGDWESWLAFFLRGVADVSTQATETARRILSLRETHRLQITEQLGRAADRLGGER